MADTLAAALATGASAASPDGGFFSRWLEAQRRAYLTNQDRLCKQGVVLAIRNVPVGTRPSDSQRREFCQARDIWVDAMDRHDDAQFDCAKLWNEFGQMSLAEIMAVQSTLSTHFRENRHHMVETQDTKALVNLAAAILLHALASQAADPARVPA